MAILANLYLRSGEFTIANTKLVFESVHNDFHHELIRRQACDFARPASFPVAVFV